MRKNIIKQLTIWLTIAVVISIGALIALMRYNVQVGSVATSELGSFYMSEMMFQIQDHFETIIDIKTKETRHIAEHASTGHIEEYIETMCLAASDMNYEYLALYDTKGNYDTLLGEDVWYRDLSLFISNVQEGKNVATTGYLTTSGGKYIVFGAPAKYKMRSGQTSDVLLLGFSVDKLYDYINLDELEQLGSTAFVEIVLDNGSYVLKRNSGTEKSFYEYIDNVGSFLGMDTEQGIYNMESAMASKQSFFHTVSIDGEALHMYGMAATEPNDWYFVISMPKVTSDKIITTQNHIRSRAFMLFGILIMLLFGIVFICYLRLSVRQIGEIEKARNAAETASLAKSTFLSNMSHDIRTPMNAIVGFSEIIEEGLQSNDEEKALNALNKLKRSSDYLRNLINDVLDMSKIESGSLELSLHSTSLKRIAETVTTIIRSHADFSQQNLQISIHDIACDSVLCDNVRLKQILINLLGNAIKFTPKDGIIDFEIWQESSKKGADYIRTHFSVTDNGIGISPEFIQTIFNSFAREDSKVRKIEGTGLGLTITKSLIDMMGGTILVESEEGVGSSFHIIIDFEKAKASESDIDLTIEDIDLTGIRLLLAEDNDFNYDIAYTLLDSYGFIMERAENGQEAVDKYCSNPSYWDIILMDLRMPVLNGYQATEIIRKFEEAHPENYHIPILALSADVFAEDISHCLEVGMEGHISKPINMNELIHTLQKYVL